MPITACKGTVDILPDETVRWRQVEEAAHQAAQRFGYKEIRTPAFEATELFGEVFADDSDVVDKELYSFKDKGGRAITFRPELTLPTLRAAVEHGLLGTSLFKGYYLGEVWRYERAHAPRLRDAHQFGVEAVGSASPAVDAEVVDLAMSFLAELGLKGLRLEVNSIGCKRCRPAYQAVLRDFFAGKDEVLCQDCERRKDRSALRILDCRREPCVRSSNTAPTVFASLCSDCKVHFQTFKDYLGLMGHEVHGNLRLVYGTGYYSRTLFQIRAASLDADQPVCVGGRFDDLVAALGGPAMPGVGFAIGLERTLQALGTEVPPLAPEKVDVFLVGSGDEAERFMTRTLHQLRKRGFRAERDYLTRGLKNQQKCGERLHPSYIVLLGEEDARVATVQVLDVARGTQESVSASRLLENLDFKLRREPRERTRERLRPRGEAADESGRRGRRDRLRDGSAAEVEGLSEAAAEVRSGARDGRGEAREERGDERRRGDRGRERGRGREERAPRSEAGRSDRHDDGADGARFAEWAATYAEAARQSTPRPERRVPVSNLALGYPDPVQPAAEVWAAAQAGLQAPVGAGLGHWPPQPLELARLLPPRRAWPERPVEVLGATWLEEHLPGAGDEAEHASAAEAELELGPPEGDTGVQDGEDDEDGALDGDEGSEEAAESKPGEKRRRSSRRGGRRHGRRRPRSSKS